MVGRSFVPSRRDAVSKVHAVAVTFGLLACANAVRAADAARAAAPGPAVAAASCPVTIPTSKQARYGTYSNAFLATTPGPKDVLPAIPIDSKAKDKPPGWDTPFFSALKWYRWQPAPLTVTGRRLDAAAPPLLFRTPGNAPPSDEGFVTTYLYLPSAGCWEITGHTPAGALTLVTRFVPVDPSTSPPAARDVAPARSRYLPVPLPRAQDVAPAPRDGPLRAQNISDEEVREIQAAMGSRATPDMLSIGAVVTGCPCEDGAGCRDQVWVVVSRPEKSYGLLFSRIDGHWTLGPVQRWWIRRHDLESNRSKFGWQEYLKASDRLNADFPSCGAKLGP
jgi:hypothetical protein